MAAPAALLNPVEKCMKPPRHISPAVAYSMVLPIVIDLEYVHSDSALCDFCGRFPCTGWSRMPIDGSWLRWCRKCTGGISHYTDLLKNKTGGHVAAIMARHISPITAGRLYYHGFLWLQTTTMTADRDLQITHTRPFRQTIRHEYGNLPECTICQKLAKRYSNTPGIYQP